LAGNSSLLLDHGADINKKDARGIFPLVFALDGKYLFFTSSRAGVDDIYWVDAGIITRLKQKTLK
jgi:hypothetical protein